MLDTLTWGIVDKDESTREHWPNQPLRTLIVRYAIEEFVNGLRSGAQPERDAGLKALALNQSVAKGEAVKLRW